MNKGATLSITKTLSFVPGGHSRNRFNLPSPNIDRWSDGFHVFMAVWLPEHQAEGPALAQYAQLIRHMARTNPGPMRSQYSWEFRIRRQSDPSLPWDSSHPQLYFQLIARYSPFAYPEPPFNFRYPVSMASQDQNMTTRNPVSQAEAKHIFKKGYCTHFNLHGHYMLPSWLHRLMIIFCLLFVKHILISSFPDGGIAPMSMYHVIHTSWVQESYGCSITGDFVLPYHCGNNH